MEQVSVGTEKKSNTPLTSRRKLSIPINLCNSPAAGNGEHSPTVRRRFSNVGDVVSRKFSTSIGWRTNTVGVGPPEEITAIGRGLCILYVRSKLKRAGVFNRKLGLTRVKSAVGSLAGCGNIVREVFPGLACAATELERMHPKLFTKISRQTGPAPGGGIAGLLLAIGHYLFRSDLTWGKIVAIYSVAGGLAVDCVRKGHHDQLHVILEDMTDIFDDRLAAWIHANGGWAALCAHCKFQDQEISNVQYLAIFALVLVILLVAYFLVRFCIKMGE